ncbi:hypothetical protein G7Y89_g11999 [Cudoniella acicularis]|uniref:Cation-transporting P-type ATPase N-terminal domain-containing protein n=1 Tax=Cudoniella acicularis TaxID=354080 RepID=A0A8H4VXS4_9HELO|nr:hypothetical protein G7Y89_g11999 [Cudoniella acicularis]
MSLTKENLFNDDSSSNDFKAINLTFRSLGLNKSVSNELSLETLAEKSGDEVMNVFEFCREGLTEEGVWKRLETYGRNMLSSKSPPKWWQLGLSIISDYFSILLLIITITSIAVPSPN